MKEESVTMINLQTFVEKFEKLFPNHLKEGWRDNFKEWNGCLQGSLTFSKMLDISYIKEKFQNEAFVNILYSLKSNDQIISSVLAYSMPYCDELYAILLQSKLFGAVDRMDMIFYKSLDVMFEQLKEKYLLIETLPLKIEQKERPEVFFSRFK